MRLNGTEYFSLTSLQAAVPALNLFLRLHIFGDLQERFKAFSPLSIHSLFSSLFSPFPSTPPLLLNTGLGEHREGWNTKFPGPSILEGGRFSANWERMNGAIKRSRSWGGGWLLLPEDGGHWRSSSLVPRSLVYFRKLQHATIPGE